MSIFYKKQIFQSEQNGELVYVKYWHGEWFLKIPEGEYYSGSYLEDMWRTVLSYEKKEEFKKILILGSGAGCAADGAMRFWPEAKIDALDYDKTIVDVGKIIYKDSKCKNVNFIISDAESFLKATAERYDLVIVDIFSGNRPVAILKDKQFLSDLKNVLESGGTIVVNVATKFGGDDDEIFKSWFGMFPESAWVKYKGNKLVRAKINKIPDDYFNIFQSVPYALSLKQNGLTVIGKPGEYFFVQPLIAGLGIVTAMHTDAMPDPEKIRQETGVKHGAMLWSPWIKVSAPSPWRRNLLPPLHQKGNGISIVCENYKDKWSQTSRRDLKKFLAANIQINSVTKEIFISGLNQSLLSSSLKKIFAGMLGRLSAAKIEYWMTEKDGEVLGGLAVMDYDNSSAHLVAFMTKGGQEFQAGTGLIDYWNQYALKNKIKYLNFGHIRESGEPRAWQGYSDFKRKFMDKEIVIDKQYFRFF